VCPFAVASYCQRLSFFSFLPLPPPPRPPSPQQWLCVKHMNVNMASFSSVILKILYVLKHELWHFTCSYLISSLVWLNFQNKKIRFVWEMLLQTVLDLLSVLRVGRIPITLHIPLNSNSVFCKWVQKNISDQNTWFEDWVVEEIILGPANPWRGRRAALLWNVDRC
jgi:hypothetical protein